MGQLATAAPRSRRRFIEHCKEYFRTVVQEASLRSRNVVLDIEEYLEYRRSNGGVKPCFDLIEYVHDIELPDKVFHDQAFVTCFDGANDMICLSNVSIDLILLNILPPLPRAIRSTTHFILCSYGYGLRFIMSSVAVKLTTGSYPFII